MQKLYKERYKLLLSLERLLEGPMIFLGLVWLVLLVIELIRGLPPALEIVSLAIWIVFLIDFVLKFILAPVKWKYLRKNWLTAISLVIPALRVFRVLRFIRLLRGLRLLRIVSSLNRGVNSLGATMKRRAFGYVVLLTLVVTFAGAAGMFAFEQANPGFETYGLALWWTAMRIITSGSDFWPLTTEGRTLAFLLALFGYSIFGYVTATLASFFIGRDAENEEASIAGADKLSELKAELEKITRMLEGKSG